MAVETYVLPASAIPVPYGADIEQAIERIAALIGADPALAARYPQRWLAIKLLEEDEDCWQRLRQTPGGARVVEEAARCSGDLRQALGDDVDTLIADRRYTWINTLVREAVSHSRPQRPSRSDRIDQIATHRWLGIPIFLAAMWAMFKLTIDISAPYLDWIDAAMKGPVANLATLALGGVGLGGTWFESLLIDGVIAGVGGVLTFLPVLAFLYLALAVLEDSGYMARAAFVMDRLMRLLGLHGKSFLPLMLGFGCNVPAIYATRTLESRRDRIFTGLLVPFMSCGARLPVYVLMAAIFFPAYGSLAVFAMYLFGILAALLVGAILARTAFKGQPASPLLMELPRYRLPSPGNLGRYVWVRLREFLAGAGTVILAASMVVWLLLAIPLDGQGRFADVPVEHSSFARVAGATSPLFEPLGFSSWENSSALLSGFVAKEVIVSTVTQVYGIEGGEVRQPGSPATEGRALAAGFVQATFDTIKSLPKLIGIDLLPPERDSTPAGLTLAVREGFEQASGGHGPLAALAFMVFVLLYTPCMAVVAAERQEFGGGWAWSSVIGQFVVAWLAAFVLYQGGLLLGVG